MTTPHDVQHDPNDPTLTPEQLAALTGFDDPVNRPPRGGSGTIDPDTGTSDLSEEEIEEEVSRHTFASHPITKLVVVAAGVAGLVLLGGFFLYALTGGGLWAKKRPTPQTSFTQAIPKGRGEDREKAELLTDLALREQRDALKNLGKTKPKPKAVPKTPQVVRAAPVREPMRVYAPAPLPRVAPTPRPLLAPTPAPTPSVDPYEQWLAQSRLGSYGTTAGAPDEQSKPLKSDGNLVDASTADSTAPRAIAPSDVPLGTRARVKLSSDIAFTDKSQEGAARYVGVLLDPIVNAGGTVAFPAGSQMVFELRPSEAPLVSLAPVAIVAKSGGQMTEYPLPPDALSVFAVGEKPLVAKERRVNKGRNKDGLNAVFGALGEAGRTLDVPGGDLPERVYRRSIGRGASYGYGGATRLYTVPRGSTVTVMAVESFSPFSPTPEATGNESSPQGTGGALPSPSVPQLPQSAEPIITPQPVTREYPR